MSPDPGKGPTDISHDDQPYWDRARAIYGDQLAHVYVVHAVKQMRVQLTDGRRVLLDRNGNQIGRTLPPAQPRDEPRAENG